MRQRGGGAQRGGWRVRHRGFERGWRVRKRGGGRWGLGKGGGLRVRQGIDSEAEGGGK